MIKYEVIPRKNPITKEVQYYAQQMAPTQVTLDQICDRVEKRSTMSHADVVGCLNALQYEVYAAMLDGNSVSLGDLGSFHIRLQSAGSATADTFKTEMIKRCMIRWTRPTKLLKAFSVGAPGLKFERAGA